jgi:hypothetical protein
MELLRERSMEFLRERDRWACEREAVERAMEFSVRERTRVKE